jgi:hypothetical protein
MYPTDKTLLMQKEQNEAVAELGQKLERLLQCPTYLSCHIGNGWCSDMLHAMNAGITRSRRLRLLLY